MLKSYPTLGDWGLWHALLACYSELLPRASGPSPVSLPLCVPPCPFLTVGLLHADISTPILHALLPLYALSLLPSFSHLWLSSTAGNANFYYAATLVWAVAMGGWALEAMRARGKREALRRLDAEGRGKVQSGEWTVVQR